MIVEVDIDIDGIVQQVSKQADIMINGLADSIISRYFSSISSQQFSNLDIAKGPWSIPGSNLPVFFTSAIDTVGFFESPEMITRLKGIILEKIKKREMPVIHKEQTNLSKIHTYDHQYDHAFPNKQTIQK